MVLALIIRAFLVQAFSIPSGSMQPTLLIGDYLLVNKFGYGIRNPLTNKIWISLAQPQRGDIVVFIFPQDPSKDYIKRVVGVPGDKVQVINKKVYVNGKELEAPYAAYADNIMIPAGQSTRDNFGPVVVPPDSYFVMGDNRDQSYDSRFWGFVPDTSLRGKAFIIYFSWEGRLGSTFLPALASGFKGLVTKFSWDSENFRVRWGRLGKLIQ
ncbi:MAG: signal peptidase I [Deltaproteobacteria bacterium]|nr:signal peptidase I [Deltaproteobacteria bacterium]